MTGYLRSKISIHEALASLDFNEWYGSIPEPISIHEALASLDTSLHQSPQALGNFDPRGSCEPRLLIDTEINTDGMISIHEALASLD